MASTTVRWTRGKPWAAFPRGNSNRPRRAIAKASQAGSARAFLVLLWLSAMATGWPGRVSGAVAPQQPQRSAPAVRPNRPQPVDDPDDSEDANDRMELRQEQSGDDDADIVNQDPLSNAIELTSDDLETLGGKDRITVAGLTIGRSPTVVPILLSVPVEWSWLGPKNVGGRTRALVIDPGDPDRIWAGSVAGGVWVNVRNNRQAWQGWKIADASLACYPVSTLVIAPRSKSIYIGTGEYIGDRVGVVHAGRQSGLRGSGVFRGQGKTRDTMTWKRITDEKSDDFDFVNRLAVAEENDRTILLAATAEGLFRYTSSPSQPGVWSRVWPGPGGFADVEFHPTDGTRVVAGTFTSGAREDGKGLFSVNAGQTWKEAKHEDWLWKGRVDLAYARANPDVVYASVAASRDGKTFRGRIFRSGDGGRTYQARATSLCRPDRVDKAKDYLNGKGDYCNALWAGDSRDLNFLLVGGPELRRSGDGGDTLEVIPHGSINDDEENFSDHHVIVEDPSSRPGGSLSVFVVNDGGVFRTRDIKSRGNARVPGPPWQSFNTGYGTVQFYSASGNAASGIIVGGAQDNDVFFSRTKQRNEPSWPRIRVGDGGVCVADLSDMTSHRFYISSQKLGLQRLELTEEKGPDGTLILKEARTEINGHFATSKTSGWKDPGFRIEDLVPPKVSLVNFIAPFVLDPNCSDRLLAGGARLWRTRNARAEDDDDNPKRSGPRWESIKELNFEANGRSVPISAIAIARGNPEIIWVGHNDGRIFQTTNGTAAQPRWEPMETPIKDGRYCTRIVIDPRDSSRVFVTFGGYHDDNLWMKKGKDPWTSLKICSSNPPKSPALRAPLRCLAIHPDYPQYFYLGTDVGIRVSGDAGATWWPIGEGPIFCPIDELFWMDRTLVAATHGRGIYSVDLKNASPVSD